MNRSELQPSPAVDGDLARPDTPPPRFVEGSLAELPTLTGRRVARSLLAAITGGLLAAVVTGVLYGWGRAYYEGYLAAFGLRGAIGAVPPAEVLFAPVGTVALAWIRITELIAVLGLIGMVTQLGSKVRREIEARLRSSASEILRALMRRPTATPARARKPEDDLSDAQFYAGGRTLTLGLGLLLAGGIVLSTAYPARDDGLRQGRADLRTCTAGVRGSVERDGYAVRSHFCVRIGDDVIVYDPSARDIVVEKWDKQRIHAVPPSGDP